MDITKHYGGPQEPFVKSKDSQMRSLHYNRVIQKHAEIARSTNQTLCYRMGFCMFCQLSKAAIPENIKHPFNLAKDQHISNLHQFHMQLGHGGRNQNISIVRRKFWITNSTLTVKRVIAKCLFCKLHAGKSSQQQMADLAEESVVPDLPPFIIWAHLILKKKKWAHNCKTVWISVRLHDKQSCAPQSG